MRWSDAARDGKTAVSCLNVSPVESAGVLTSRDWQPCCADQGRTRLTSAGQADNKFGGAECVALGMMCHVREVALGDLDILAGPAEQAHELFRRDEPSNRLLSLEKSWHGLHYLLTGSARGGKEPLCFLSRGGRSVGRDLGYGRPRLLGGEFVRRLDADLQGISDEELWRRFDAARFTAEGIYPFIWDEPEDQLRDEYVDYFHRLKGFVNRAAARGGELLVVVV
jgi:Domain of unknown function (DUF1877)